MHLTGGSWHFLRRSQRQAHLPLVVDIRLTHVMWKIKKYHIWGCSSKGSRGVWGTLSCVWGHLNVCNWESWEQCQHHSGIRLSLFCLPFQQWIRYPCMNKSASGGSMGPRTIHQGTWEESHSPVHLVMGRQTLVQAKEPSGASELSWPLWAAVGENLESADLDIHLMAQGDFKAQPSLRRDLTLCCKILGRGKVNWGGWHSWWGHRYFLKDHAKNECSSLPAKNSECFPWRLF